MNTTTQAPAKTGQASRQAPGDVFDRLARLAADGDSVLALYRSSLAVLADHFQSRYATLHVFGSAGTLDETVTGQTEAPAFFRRATEAASLESQADGVALARFYDVDGSERGLVVMSVALRDELGNGGAVAMVIDSGERVEMEKILFELKALVTLLGRLGGNVAPSGRREAPAPDESVVRAIGRAARFASLTEFAFGITNGLKTRYECGQVALGRVCGRRVRLLSVSGVDGLYPRSPGTRLIRQAMEECLDAGCTVCSAPGHQWSDQGPGRDYRLHRQWRAAVGDAAVASIPIVDGDQTVAVISLTRPGKRGLRDDELDEIGERVNAYGPGLTLVERASRSWPAQTRDSLWQAARWLLGRRQIGRKLVAVAALAVLGWFVLGHAEYRLSVPCRVAPKRVRHFAAPFEGPIGKAFVEAGDRVRAGQLLYEMDTQDLEIERSQLLAQIAVDQLERDHAVADRKLQDAALAQARLDVLHAQLAGVENRIRLARVEAPADGVILAGDLPRRVGEVVPLGAPLLEFAPQDSWTIELRVRDEDAHLVRRGQAGRFVTQACPEHALPCVIDRVEPTATVVDGDNVLLARATVETASGHLVAGMDGVAAMEVGRRPAWWIAMHRLIRFVRLRFWI